MPTNVSLPNALLLSVVGFCVVLFALGLLAIFIVIMAKMIGSSKDKNNSAEPVKEAASVPAPVPAAPVKDPNKVPLPETTSMGECDLHNVSDRDAALIMAIIAEQLQAPLNTLVFKSIKEVK